jgi:hypothetical protein
MPTAAEKEEVAAPFITCKWVRENPDAVCNMSNGGGALLVNMKNLKPDKTTRPMPSLL